MELRKNIPLIVGLTIPVIMILLVAASIYIPSFFVESPRQDFAYAIGTYPAMCSLVDGKYSRNLYSVKNGHVVRSDEAVDKCYTDSLNEPQFFVHDTIHNTNRELSFEELTQLNLNPGARSENGFEVSRGDNGGDFPFIFGGGNGYGRFYLRKDSYSQRIDIPEYSDYYDNRFHFIGWVK